MKQLAVALGAILCASIAFADVPEDWDGKLLKGEPPSDFETNMPPFMGTKDLMRGKPISRAPVTHDVLILYSKAALTNHGQAGIDKLVQRIITDTNAAYAASKVNITLRLIDTGLSPVAESGSGVCNTLKAFRENKAVQDWRNRVKADFGMMLTMDTGSYVGCASLRINNGVVDAFDVMKTRAVANKTGQHEIGHLQGLAHNIENGSSAPAFPWGYG